MNEDDLRHAPTIPAPPIPPAEDRRRDSGIRTAPAFPTPARLPRFDDFGAELVSDGRTPCRCGDGSCMLCDDQGFLPAEVGT